MFSSKGFYPPKNVAICLALKRRDGGIGEEG
jgi:hypothetical protein